MSIILNENAYAKECIKNNDIGKKSFETVKRVARYYIDGGCEKKELRNKIELFMLQCGVDGTPRGWSKLIDSAIKKAYEQESIEIDFVPITDTELKQIDQLKGKQLKRLAFTLLCISKYWDMVRADNNHWVNSKDSDIMKMANINTSLKRQGLMYYKLKEQKLVKFPKQVDNTNTQVLFQSDGKIILKIKDFRNLGYQYQKYCGEPFFECVECGITVKASNPKNIGRQKYCKDCAAKIRVLQTREAVRRHRETVD